MNPTSRIALSAYTNTARFVHRDVEITGHCPFCGSSDLFMEEIGSDPLTRVVCRNCWSTGPSRRGHDKCAQNDAAKAWNTRS